MKTIAVRSGLSARRKTTLQKHFFCLLLFLVSLTGCHDTSRGQEQASIPEPIAQDTIHKPDVKITVNKRYDDAGNLIGFDSLYSSYYSSGNTLNSDSLRHQFESYFNNRHSMFFRDEMNGLFFQDTLQYPDFFHQDFFRKHLELNDAYMNDMMQRMDSIKNEFYRRHRRTKPEGKTL